MKNDLKKEIIDHFLNEVKESELFSSSELEKLKIIAYRGELESKSIVENFVDSFKLKSDNENQRTEN